MSRVSIVHFSDVLCIWAYGGDANLYRLAEEFGDKVSIDIHYCSVFPDTKTKINAMWRERGGFEGYSNHVRDVATRFETLSIHPDIWSKVRPRSSASPHLFIKAMELHESSDPASAESVFAEKLSIRSAKELRHSFFANARDISNWKVQAAICEKIGVSFDSILEKIETGEAIACLASDYELAQSLAVQGSPTYLMNEGRQKLFGNVSYGILAANVTELLSDNRDENASSCY